MSRFLTAALAGLMLTGCYKIDYVAGPSAPYPQTTEWHHIGIFGLVEFSEPVRLNVICPNGFARVHHEVSLGNGLVHWLLGGGLGYSSGWYSPSTVMVYCSTGQAYDVQVDRDGLATAAQRLPDVEPTADAGGPMAGELD